MTSNISKRIKLITMYTLVFLLGVIQLFPLIWIVNYSLVKDTELYGKSILTIPNPPQWGNYLTAWVEGNILRYTLNSIFVTTIVIVVTVFLSLTLGYAFSRMRWKHSKLFLTIIMLGIMIPIHTTLIPNFIIYSKLNLTDSYLGILVPYIAFSMPVGVYLMTGFLEGIPRSIEESAVIDGCGIYDIIFRIIMPITKPTIVTIIVMTFISIWNEFIVASTMLSNNDLKTLPFAVFNFTGQYSSRYAVQFAVMTLSAIPALIVYIVFNEQITKGVMEGSVKG